MSARAETCLHEQTSIGFVEAFFKEMLAMGKNGNLKLESKVKMTAQTVIGADVICMHAVRDVYAESFTAELE